MDSQKMKKIILSVLVVGSLLFSISFAAFAEPWRSSIKKFKDLNTFKQEVIAENGVITTNHQLASPAGLQVLIRGGNAVDALIATFFALSVVQPQMMSPWGAGFINLYTKDGQSITLDNYAWAPRAATPNMYKLVYPDDEKKQAEAGHVTVGNENRYGFKASGVPGAMKAWLWVLKNFGSRKLSLKEIMQPAIEYAKNGFLVTPFVSAAISTKVKEFSRFPGWVAEFLPGGKVPQPDTILKRPAYAVTLEAIADAAPPGASFDEQLEAAGTRFYKGDIAKNITDHFKANGGIITMQDLADYYGSGLDDMSATQGLRLRNPVRGYYRGYEIITMGPTSSGGTHIVEMLNILEGFDLKGLGFGHPKTLHLMAEAMKIAWADRDEYMGDPDYAGKDPSCSYPIPPVQQLISKDYAAERREEIHPSKSGTYEPGDFSEMFSGSRSLYAFNKPSPYTSNESSNTTHATAIDIEGNLISMTQTLNGWSGGVLPGMVPGSGMCLDNTMYLFDPDPRCGYERANGIAPKKRMLSSMSPTIVLKDGKPFIVIGVDGGSKIFGTVMQGIINIIDHRMNIQQAVEAPRIWTMMYGNLEVEEGFPVEVTAALEKMGHSITRARTTAGCMNGGLIDPQTELIHAGACWRQDGTTTGWSGGNALSSYFPYPPSWDSLDSLD